MLDGKTVDLFVIQVTHKLIPRISLLSNSSTNATNELLSALEIKSFMYHPKVNIYILYHILLPPFML
jgi:hypothetical protein